MPRTSAFGIIFTVWKVSKYGVFSGPNTGKHGTENFRTWTLFTQWLWNWEFVLESKIWNNSSFLLPKEYFCRLQSFIFLTNSHIYVFHILAVKGHLPKFTISLILFFFQISLIFLWCFMLFNIESFMFAISLFEGWFPTA